MSHALQSFPSTGFELIDHSEKIEEETLPTYQVENESKYAVLKVYVSGEHVQRNREINIYNRINSVQTTHLGKSFIHKLLGHFYIEGPHGRRHICLVHQPLGLSVEQFLSFFPERVLSIEDLKPCLRQILGVLDFLHAEARIIHTDDPQIFSSIEEAEIEEPSPRKILDDGRTIYLSRLPLPSNGLPLLSDFGEARFGDEEHNEDIMPNVYREKKNVNHLLRDSVISPYVRIGEEYPVEDLRTASDSPMVEDSRQGYFAAVLETIICQDGI
ncbi:hypothetical protein T310_1943 [Rasamsonia emersonii CBS 393.64]|uniref:non-specific serine/threonine protein kinase n=1 Tax=Rasamsonia emersonii (strain ATCC 16479 / CBS 393.64 / IMI 116815) TaxID=1408163 RepID=A0A0F4Z0H1_RASE3|nr:hypothetical protein T310_1943 [Rasamsonia emersonii CBS 393.64]KKA24022.1 hypothetical protein T310_1943 [Rasamsonia emersonii CBS 393.64]